MIRRLKRKLLLLTTVSLFLLLSLIVSAMNLLNYHSVLTDADEVLDLLSSHQGAFPPTSTPQGAPLPPELPYESRYFSVGLTEEGQLTYIDTGRIAAVNSKKAAAYAERVFAEDEERGFVDHFRYRRDTDGRGHIRITFLDCGRRLDSFWEFCRISCLMALCGLVIVFFVIFFCAGRLLRPISEAHEKQKRFITDAGHELKTPLTVIRANADILEMEQGKNEELAEIRHQTERLRRLTEELVYLSRIEEEPRPHTMIEFPLSEVVRDAAVAFRAPIKQANKHLQLEIAPLLTLCGDAAAIEKLVSVLMDNAVKYSPAGSEIRLSLAATDRHAVLTLSNESILPLEKGATERVFERFWRADPSRNSETGGNGIGLSVAHAIVRAHGGRIRAEMDAENRFCIVVTLPRS